MLSSLLLLAAAASRASALWPAPAQMTNGSTFLKLSDSFSITLSSSIPSSISDSVKNAASAAEAQAANDKMWYLKPGRGTTDADAISSATELSGLTVQLSNTSTSSESAALTIEQETSLPVEQWDESYALSITAQGSATLEAASSIGLLRGLQTFTLLVYTLPNSTTSYIPNAPIQITDKPAFAWRGFLLDTSRHYFPVEDILRTMDAMSWAKLNVFNWHITDSQSWPLFVPAFPAISAKGAYWSDELYTTDDVQKVIAYGQALGIATVIEIDTPGHTASIGAAYPDYIACPQLHPWGTYANEPPSGQLRYTVPEVQNFTNQLIASVLTETPAAYWSTGGDELNTECYKEDNVTQASLSSQGLTLESALTRFVLSTHDTVRSANKTPVVWEEMALDHDVGKSLGNDTVILVWISSADAKEVADQGLRMVHVPSDYFYLDCGAGGWIPGNPDSTSWCDPYKTWQKIYSFDPYANLTSSQYDLVLGGQTAVWAEQTDSSNLDPLVWPRAATAGEVFWTGTSAGGKTPQYNEAIGRLHDWRYRAVARGVRAIPLQPEFCALSPGECLAS